MLAPIDATATVDVGGETLTLTLNFRTLALAAKGGVDLLSPQESEGQRSLTMYPMATLIAAFAAPAHPDFAEEQAFSLLVGHAGAGTAAIQSLLTDFSEAVSAARGTEAGGKPSARPRGSGRRKADV
jgi:hypothetical protein